MRIAHVCQSYPPMISGAALAVQQLATGMAARGHDVLVLAASDRKEAYRQDHDHLQVVRLHSRRNPLRSAQRFVLWPQQEIGRQLEMFGADVVHLHEPLGLGVCGLLAARGLGVPTALTLHQLPWFTSAYLPAWPGIRPMVEAMLWKYGKWLLRQCTAVITSTNTIAEIVHARASQRPHVATLGVDLERFTPQAPDANEARRLRLKMGLDPHLPVILHVGRIDAEKQVEQIVRATARVLQQEKAQLLVVGDGHRLDTVVELSRRLGIDRHCHFPGAVPIDGDLPGLYRLATAFATASPIETFGYVVLEAMASALPLVAVQAGSLPELIEDGVSGFLAPPGDENALAERLIWLLRNPEEARSMGQIGLRSSARFGLSASLAQHENLYRLLDQTQARRRLPIVLKPHANAM